MADTNETTNDIIAEERFDATTRDQFDSAYIVDFCDRFDAALKRDRLGSKTREDWDKVYMTLRKWIDEAMAALAVPMRNCDRYATLPDALAAWRDVDPREAGTFDEWLFAPATEKEGANDGR